MLGSIIELVKRRVTFSETENSEILGTAQEVCVELEAALGKLHMEFLDYSDLERLLIADLTAYQYIESQMTKSASNTTDSIIKKVKADVVEVEYDTNISSNTSKSGVLEKLRKSACAKAYTLGISLSICEIVTTNFPTPFRVFN